MSRLKTLSLVDEVAGIGAAVDGVFVLLQRLEQTGSRLTPDGARVMGSSLAVTGLVAARLSRLGDALTGVLDPALLLGPTRGVPDEFEQDPRVRICSGRERLTHAEKDVQRLRRLVGGSRRRGSRG